VREDRRVVHASSLLAAAPLAKLGVRSRAQLARLAADGELADAGLPSQARR
jgi:hypothetical protein